MKEYKELTIDYNNGLVKKLTPHKHFSGEYVDERNKLIPKAERYANNQEGAKKDNNQTPEEYAEKWNKCFHPKMNLLWSEYARQ